MNTKFPWWIRFGLPVMVVTLSVASYSSILWSETKTIAAYAKPTDKAVTTMTKQLSQVHNKLSLTQNQLQQLALKYQGLLGTARQDETIINQVNSQLSASGIPIVPNVPTSFPIVNGYATNSPPPVFQTMTAAS
jgi:hypothetical protein